MSSNEVQVRLQDGTIGVPDKFLVGNDEYNTQHEAELAIKEDRLLNIRDWIGDWTTIDKFDFSDELSGLDKTIISKFIELLKELT